jgi:predicted double-glycine peptidase
MIKTVVNIDVLRPEIYPFIREQNTGYSCGHTSMKALVEDLTGKRVSEDRLIKLAHEVEKDLVCVKETTKTAKLRYRHGEGWKYNQLYFTGVKAIAEKFRLGGVVLLNPSRELFDSILQNRIRSMIEWKDPRTVDEHYSIVIGQFSNQLLIADPGTNEQLVYLMRKKDFFKLWESQDKHRRLIPTWRAWHAENDIYRRLYGHLGRNF